MRWIRFIILVYLVILVQVSLAGLVTVATPLGRVKVDFAAVAAVFVAFYARQGIDAMLACWILGLAVDLTTGGGLAGSPVVGPMALGYAILGGMLWRVRDAFFRDRALTQAFLTALFCLAAQCFWITAQSLRMGVWRDYGSMLLQAIAVAVFTALMTPLVQFVLQRTARWIFLPAGNRSR